MSQAPVLDINQPQKVSYCIPLWQRDEQIKAAIPRVKGRIQHVGTVRKEPVAVVCFGPSLNDTWEKVKDFEYVISCSGSHKFLVERGIIPSWHVEVDPRPHKVQLIGPPHKDVEYLIASTCHRAVFDHLEGFNVKLWHVFAAGEEAERILPPGEWALTGGSSVGLRALTIAHFLGFREIHVFGMDGCEGKSGKHADVHPMQPKGHSIVEYGGVQYRTTPSMLECAKQTRHELDQLKDVTMTFHGEGLVQAMLKDYKPQHSSKPTVIATQHPVLITEEYRDLNRRLHSDNLAYGVGGGKYAPVVLKLVESIKSKSVLDYGCGKGYLAKALPFPIWEYDPAVPGKETKPRAADLVVCTDVLEHIEPEKVEFVLMDLARCTRKVGFFVIHTGPSMKTLADGRNAHLIQQGESWWRERLEKQFTIGKIQQSGPELIVIVGPKPAQTLSVSR